MLFLKKAAWFKSKLDKSIIAKRLKVEWNNYYLIKILNG